MINFLKELFSMVEGFGKAVLALLVPVALAVFLFPGLRSEPVETLLVRLGIMSPLDCAGTIEKVAKIQSVLDGGTVNQKIASDVQAACGFTEAEAAVILVNQLAGEHTLQMELAANQAALAATGALSELGWTMAPVADGLAGRLT